MTQTERKNQSKILEIFFKEVAGEIVHQANLDQQHKQEEIEEEFEAESVRLTTNQNGAELKYSKHVLKPVEKDR